MSEPIITFGFNPYEDNFFSSNKDFSPRFYIHLGELSESGGLTSEAQDKTSLKNYVVSAFEPFTDNSLSAIQEITITKQAQTPQTAQNPQMFIAYEAQITISANISNIEAMKRLEVFTQPTPTHKVVVIKAAYDQMDSDKLNLAILGVKENERTDDRGNKVKVDAVDIKNYVTGNIPKESVVLFAGNLRRPNITGDDRGNVTMNVSAVGTYAGGASSNYTALYNKQKPGQAAAPTSKAATDNAAPKAIPLTEEKRKSPEIILDLIFGSSDVFEENSNKKKIIPAKTPTAPLPKKIRDILAKSHIYVNYESLKDVKRERPTAFSTIPQFTGVDSVMSFINRIANNIGVNYRLRYIGAASVIEFYDFGNELISGVENPPKLDAKDKVAIILPYGYAVTNFSWSASPFATSNGSISVKESGNGKLVLGELRDDGIYLEYEINKESIQEYASGKGLGIVKDAVQWVKENLDEFIANFTSIKRTTKYAGITPTNIGQNNISLQLTLKRAIPELFPGTLVYFYSPIVAGDKSTVFPKYLTTYYKIQKVTDKFSSRGNFWTQTIECVR